MPKGNPKRDKPTLWIEVRPAAQLAGGFSAQDAQGQKRTIENARTALRDLGEVLSDTTADFWKALQKVAPDKVELELALALEGKTNWLVVGTKGSASVTVKLAWGAEVKKEG